MAGDMCWVGRQHTPQSSHELMTPLLYLLCINMVRDNQQVKCKALLNMTAGDILSKVVGVGNSDPPQTKGRSEPGAPEL